MVLEKPPASSGGALIPEGFGTVTVRLTQGAARTAMPEIEQLTALSLKYFFTKDAVQEEKTAEGGKFILEPGTYSLTVEVYANETELEPAARGTKDEIIIVAGVDAEPVDLFLYPVASRNGFGDLDFSLTYPAGATVETFTLTQIGGAFPIDLTEERTPSGTDPVVLSGLLSGPNAISAGYYLLQVALKNSAGISTGQVEVVHIYQDLTTTAEYVFTAGDFMGYQVTSAADSGPGSLRQVLEAVPSGGTIALAPGAVIELEEPLEITKSLTIEGNGATLTRSASWTSSDNNSQLLRITGAAANVVIRRLHFKNGLATNNGGAISNSGILTLESCVFSDNQTTDGSAQGGAVWSNNTLTIRGCTFYGNTTGGGGGAVYFYDSGYSKTLTMTGNLFYGNTAGGEWGYPVAELYDSISASYNVVDVDFGAGDKTKAGWVQGTGDTLISNTDNPIDSDFVPTGSPDINIVPSGLADFPTTDFYGNARTFPGDKGAAGAVNYQ
jgi:hypothetical protein